MIALLLLANVYAAGDDGFSVSDGVLTVSDGELLMDYESVLELPWYKQRNEIVSLVVHEGITSIGSNAFNGLERLESVTLPAGITSIGSGAFANTAIYDASVKDGGMLVIGKYLIACDMNASGNITVPEGIVTIADTAFYGCRYISSVTFADSVENIGEYAFWVCSKLENIKFSQGLKAIGAYAFKDCASLKDVTLPANLPYIGQGAFSSCKELNNVIFPEKAEFVGNNVLEGTAYFLNEKNWSDGVLYAGKVLVKAKSNLSGTCKIKEGTVNIACAAFAGCGSLNGVVIPEGVKYIGDSAFRESAIIGVIFPESVISIGYGAFMNCYEMKYAAFAGNTTEFGKACFEATELEFFAMSDSDAAEYADKTGITVKGFDQFDPDSYGGNIGLTAVIIVAVIAVIAAVTVIIIIKRRKTEE